MSNTLLDGASEAECDIVFDNKVGGDLGGDLGDDGNDALDVMTAAFSSLTVGEPSGSTIFP